MVSCSQVSGAAPANPSASGKAEAVARSGVPLSIAAARAAFDPAAAAGAFN
jgi:hypothetical protein